MDCFAWNRRAQSLGSLRVSALVVALVSWAVPADAQILCPFLKAPSELFGIEDIPINVQREWNLTVGTSGQKPAFRMYNLDPLDCQYQDREEITEDKLQLNAPVNSRDAVVLKVSVKTGRIWLDRGYHLCRDASGTVVNDANFTESTSEIKSFEVEGLFHEVNCMLQYVVFQTLVNGNSEFHIAEKGEEPFITIHVGPRCEEGPFGCGANFGTESEVTTVMHMDTVNDLPRLESCPTTTLSRGSDTLSWDAADGDLSCQSASTFIGGPLIRNPPRSGGVAPPTRITPPFCQNEDTSVAQPPHCGIYRDVPNCLANPSSFVYHIEDEDDANLEIQGLRVTDPDLWDGHVTMKWTLRFRPGQTAGDRGYNDPVPANTIPLEAFYEIESELGPMNDYCARPSYNRAKRASQLVGSKYCSQSTADSLGGVFVPKNEQNQDNYEQLQIRVLTSQDREPEDGVCKFVLDGTPQHPICTEVLDAELELVNCVCKSRVYERLISANGTEIWKSIFFYDIIERDTFEVFETGYFIVTYSTTEVTSGRMFADEGVRAWEGGSERVDLFMASPFTITGTVDVTGGDRVIMELQVTTDAAVNPKFAVSLSSNYGSIAMPNAQVALQTDTPTLKTFLGTIDQVNEAIWSLVYQLPSSTMPSFHTMAQQHALYGEVRETITLSIDDLGYTGRPAAVSSLTMNGRLVGSASVFEYDVVVVADNDTPQISNPTESYTVPENTWTALPGFTISDVDAKDVLINVQNKSTIELKMTLECMHGALRLNPDVGASLHVVEPRAAGCNGPCGTAAINNPEQLMLLSDRCRACLKEEAMLLMHEVNGVGARRVVLFGSVELLDASLQSLSYKAEPGFNSLVPEDGNPFSDGGCPVEVAPGESSEFVLVALDDIGNVGCRAQESKSSELRRTIDVSPAEDPPRISFEVNGNERCPRCVDCPCRNGCGGLHCAVPRLQTTEDSVYRFQASAAVAVRDYDTTELDFGSVQYELMVNSTWGSLALPNAPDVTPLDGFQSCTSAAADCPVIRVQGPLCEINKALQRIEYRPNPNYNSDFGEEDSLWFGIKQIGLNHPDELIRVSMAVVARNDQPMINLLQSGSSERSVRTSFMDFYLVEDMDAVPAQCGSELECIHISDPDACEAKYRHFGIQAGLPDLVAAQKGTSPVCALNMSDTVGLVTLRVTTRMGSVWFFPKNGSELLEPDGSISLGDRVEQDVKSGKRSQDLSLSHPLSWFLGGVLRYYASSDFARPDAVTLEIDDNGNTGQGAGEAGFCCCADAECSSCSAGACKIDLDVTACNFVEGYQCKDSVKGVKHLAGWQISLIAASCFVCLFGTISAIIYVGANTGQMKLVHPDAEEEEAGGKLAKGNGADKQLLVEEGRTENVLAI